MRAPEQGETFMHVRLSAADVREVEKGTFEVVLPAKAIPAEHFQLLENLFPNTFVHIDRLLATEALIKAIKH